VFLDFPKAFKEVEPVPGWKIHVFAGERLSFSRMTLKPDTEAAMHTHSNEQMGIILEGQFEMKIGDETRLLGKGDMYHVASNINHGGFTHARGAQILDVFSPPRDYKK